MQRLKNLRTRLSKPEASESPAEQQSLLETLGVYVTPDHQIAQRHANRIDPSYKFLSTTSQDLQHFGKGLQAFFNFQTWLCLLFLAMSIGTSVANMIFNSEGDDSTAGAQIMVGFLWRPGSCV